MGEYTGVLASLLFPDPKGPFVQAFSQEPQSTRQRSNVNVSQVQRYFYLFYVKEQLKMVKKIRELTVVKISQLHTSWRTDFVSESYDIHNDIF